MNTVTPKLKFPLFGDEGADRIRQKSISAPLKTTHGHSRAAIADNTFLRDVFGRDTQRDLGQPYTRSRYYHLYINGLYWGLYMTQERAEARYGATYFGGNAEDYDTMKSGGSSLQLQHRGHRRIKHLDLGESDTTSRQPILHWSFRPPHRQHRLFPPSRTGHQRRS